jgi:UDP-MurNAc hydroxylase
MTELKILSHASAIVSTETSTLIMDPWLIGSCYWRSWWNYPPVKKEVYENIQVDAIYITHFHWDHWHGPTLKKLFSKNTLIITHDEPNKRSVKDLKDIGFKNIKVLKHGESLNIGDIKITPYQFGLFLNDSALVIETPEIKILNANDCKIAGTALRSIVKKHKKFDFALRSHSSANDRVCYTIENSDFSLDDKNHYSRSFALFMNAVKPKYAIPFASNHCHLHKDVYGMNDNINDPYKLVHYLEENSLLQNTDVKVMLSGDSWSSEFGFRINEVNESFFKEKQKNIENYKLSVDDKLEAYYNLEDKIQPNTAVIEKFQQQILKIPKFLRRRFGDFEYKLILFNSNQEFNYVVRPENASIKLITSNDDYDSQVRIPIKIFMDSVVLNMFHHASISKRNRYIFKTEEDLKKYQRFQKLLEYVEMQVLPINIKYIVNLFSAYFRRWRELLVYFNAFLLKRKGMPIYDIEEEILSRT